MVPVALKLPLWDGPPDFSWPLGTQEQQKIGGTWFAHLITFFLSENREKLSFFAFFEVFDEFWQSCYQDGIKVIKPLYST